MDYPETQVFELLKERSLLGLLLTSEELIALLKQFQVVSVARDTILARQNEIAKNVTIIVSGKATLYNLSENGEKVVSGTLEAGRAANLYSVVRKMPFQYSVISEEKCEILTIPWASLEPFANSKSGFIQYLQYMTEYPLIRHLKKEMEEINCNKDFIIHFLGHLNFKKVQGQQWLSQQGKPCTYAFVVQEGAVQAFQPIKNTGIKTLWEVPRNSWQLWSECAQSDPAKYSYKTILASQLFTLEKSDLEALRQIYADDFKNYDQRIIKAGRFGPRTSEHVEGDQESVIDSITDLFPDIEKQKKIWHFSYPFVEQNDTMDCGPACLAMIAKFYGKEIGVQNWRDRVYTNQEGTTLFDLAKATESVGFTSHSIGIDSLDDIETELLPCIVLRKYHFMVLYEVNKKDVVIGDPGLGVLKMTHKEFYEGFENVVLLLKPTDEFQLQAEDVTGHWHYLNIFRGLTKEILLILATSGILVLLNFCPPLLSQIIIDEVLSKKDLTLLAAVIGGGFLIVICSSIVTWLRQYYIYFLTSKFDFKTNSTFLKKMFSLPYSFFANRHIGDFTRRLSEMERIRMFFSSTALPVLLDLTVMGLYAIVLFIYSPILLILAFTLSPLTTVLSMLTSRKLANAYGETFRNRAEQESLIADLVKGVSTIKTMGAELSSRWRYEERLVKTLISNYQYSMTNVGMTTITEGYTQIVKNILMGTSAYLGIKGSLTPGQVIAVSMIINQIVDPFKNLSRGWATFQEMKVILSRLDDIFLSPSELRKGRGGVTKSRFRGEIEFQDVWFRYGGESSDWVLRGLSIKIEASQHVAIVGKSGCGKSTIGLLLSRLFEPVKGYILIDGRDYREYDVEWLRTQVGTLMQEPRLFYGSISENIAYGYPSINDFQVTEAAKVADAHEFISEKQTGYNYLIMHDGIGLSGGQKQRLAFARTIYNNPSILVLDESTSALDGISESKLLASLSTKFKKTTILSIAHRYTTAVACDYALVIDQGVAAQFGTHEQLLNEDGLYTQLFGLNKRRAA